MSINITLFHSPKAGDKNMVLPKGFWHMATCLRSIIVTDHSGVVPMDLSEYHILRNEEAFQFLLEIVCGLHSPMLGETEVLGQFKDFVRDHQGQWSFGIQQVMDKVLQEAKQLRQNYLQNLGCTSYGSLLRKQLRGKKANIFMIGAGSLAKDILPWFSKTNVKVNLFTRNPDNHDGLTDLHPGAQVKSYGQIEKSHLQGVLVVAAPVSAQWLQEQLQLDQFQQVFDLRGNCQEDPINHASVTNLQEFFADIEFNKVQAQQIKEQVIAAIDKSVAKLRLIERPRPFGWEDLWAYS